MTEERITNPQTGGQKGRKPERYELLPFDVLAEVARVYAMGASKYEDDNWKLGYDYGLSFGALMRHITAWWEGENNDLESGESHLAHAVFHCFTLMWFEMHGEGFDDRPHARLARSRPLVDTPNSDRRGVTLNGVEPVVDAPDPIVEAYLKEERVTRADTMSMSHLANAARVLFEETEAPRNTPRYGDQHYAGNAMAFTIESMIEDEINDMEDEVYPEYEDRFPEWWTPIPVGDTVEAAIARNDRGSNTVREDPNKLGYYITLEKTDAHPPISIQLGENGA